MMRRNPNPLAKFYLADSPASPRWGSSVWPLLAGLIVTVPGQLQASPERDPNRLTQDVVPTLGSLNLQLDARDKAYGGNISFDLVVKSPVDAIRFHARALELEHVTLQKRAAPGAPAPLEPPISTVYQAGAADLVAVRAPQPIPPGEYSLQIAFKNELDTQAIGLYRVAAQGEAYIFSQFEASYARSAFPCFDEPGFKHPWQVTLTVPGGDEAITNTPVMREEVLPGGKKRLTFLRSKPLPSYLLAFAEGPLESAPLEGMSIPGRIYTTKGKLPYAREALKVTPPILKALEQYFGHPYPFEKLDILAAPEFMYGAMENPGAIVFRESLLLMDGQKLTLAQKSHMYETMAHELAHIWFGDWVTMAWWNDLWLNESFASWMASKVMDQLYPELKYSVHTVHTLLGALGQDGRLSSKAIRRNVSADQQALQRIGLAYSKGESVLGMIERWLGPETFRKGVLSYLEAHAWGTAEGEALWNALQAVSGKPVAQAMASFLDLPGAPLIRAELVGGTQLKLTQKRMLLTGQTDPNAGLWSIPVVFRYPDGDRILTDGFLLTAKEQLVPLKLSEKAHSNPKWIHLNADESGYYRWILPEMQLMGLIKSSSNTLSVRERIALLNHTSALVGSGELSADAWLTLIQYSLKEQDPSVKLAALGALGEVFWFYVKGAPELRPAWESLIASLLAPELEKLGWAVGEEESLEQQQWRASLILTLAGWAKHRPTREEATRRADQFLVSPESLHPSLTEAIIAASALSGDRARFLKYQQRFERAQDPKERELFLRALARFEAPALAAEALEYSLKGPLRPQEVAQIAFTLAEESAHQDLVLQFVKRNAAPLADRIAPPFRIHFPWLAGGCSETSFAAWRPFFVEYANGSEEFLDVIQEVSEAVGTCAQQRRRDGSAVKNWLEKSAYKK